MTGMIGADAAIDRWLFGAVLAHSEGQGEFTQESAGGGSVRSRLTSLHPFARYTVNERASLWSTVGYGIGDLALKPDNAHSSIETDLSSFIAAVGGRGVLRIRPSETGSFELAVKSDAVYTNTVSSESENLMAANAVTQRVRVLLQGTGSRSLTNGGLLSPTIETGLRYDGGDAETGAGLEINRRRELHVRSPSRTTQFDGTCSS